MTEWRYHNSLAMATVRRRSATALISWPNLTFASRLLSNVPCAVLLLPSLSQVSFWYIAKSALIPVISWPNLTFEYCLLSKVPCAESLLPSLSQGQVGVYLTVLLALILVISWPNLTFGSSLLSNVPCAVSLLPSLCNVCPRPRCLFYCLPRFYRFLIPIF